jgi:prephenate dehydrogenase
MQRQHIKTISFAGLGLIGTSLLLALRRAAAKEGRSIEMIGYDPGFGPEDIACITGTFGLDRFESDPAKLYHADLIVLCAPVVTNIALLEEIRRHAPQGTLVTDVSSTKSTIASKAGALGLDFLGMHPIAGREQQGYRAAAPELLSGHLLIICSGSGMPDAGRAGELLSLLEAAGCVPVVMTPEEHDRIYANISHLPQLISTALMNHCRENIGRSGPGFASLARLSGSPWNVWRDIVITNNENIAGELEAFAECLSAMAAEVRTLKLDELESRFRDANRLYQSLQEGVRP